MPILNWLNRDENISQERNTPCGLLKENLELSRGTRNTENMLIQGDNLAALKALLPSHAGKIKCIFIDPPYNTKSTFKHYDDNLCHAKWLEMMYPRLELLRELLAEDGSIWVIVDDSESHYLKIIMDEVFGRKNFVANCVWQRKYAPISNTRYISYVHDTVLCFSKNKRYWKANLLPRTQAANKKYKNRDGDPRGQWAAINLSVKGYYKKNDYIITSPKGLDFRPPPGRCWGVSKDKYKALLKDSRIWFGKNGAGRPCRKTFLSEVQQGMVPTTLWLHEESGHNMQANAEIKNLFKGQENLFATPKPEKLAQKILTIATNENDIVLDAFLGSGTTVAVAHKMQRSYVGIEIGEHAKAYCAARLQKVINGEQGGISKDVNWQGGGGFSFYTLGTQNSNA